MKPLPNNEFVSDKFDSRKWSVRKVRRRKPQHVTLQKNEKNDNVMIFCGNVGKISLDAISSDDDSTISDDETDGLKFI